MEWNLRYSYLDIGYLKLAQDDKGFKGIVTRGRFGANIFASVPYIWKGFAEINVLGAKTSLLRCMNMFSFAGIFATSMTCEFTPTRI